MKEIIELLQEAIGDIRRIEAGPASANSMYMDCALIRIQGAIEIAEMHQAQSAK